MARKICQWFIGTFQPLQSKTNPEIPIWQGREKRRWGRESVHVCVHWVWIYSGKYWEIWWWLWLQAQRSNNLYDRKHTHTKKKSSPITITRRDQMLSVTQSALFQIYTTKQNSYITMYKRMPLLWVLRICTRCGTKLVYIEESFICQCSVFWKQYLVWSIAFVIKRAERLILLSCHNAKKKE